MAIAFAQVSYISRNKGKSSVAAAAYRSAERIEDLRIGLTFDYTNKPNVYHKEIMLPVGTSKPVST